ncbi:MAG: LytTR family transcriptional regulator [Alphaproteobacteria bacterium]|nr:LytTR family transcriptional regulator [Alphaproteobacteria bacterium]
MKPAASGRRLQVEAAAVVAAIAVAAIAGPFGTWQVPGPQRTLFWAAAILVNAVKWGLWFRLVAPRFGESLRAQIGSVVVAALLLNATLPFEIAWLMRAVGLDVGLAWGPLYVTAMTISLAITLVVFAVPRAAPAAPPLPATGLLARANAAPADLLAVEAEDHYLRLHLTGGRRPLILYRFKDALAELAPLDGAQVHRGAWVAAAAVAGAEREGRKWRLRLADGTRIPVSDSFAAVARERGWLRTRL